MSLVAENLIKSYRGRKVVHGVSLHVERGEVVGLLGPNGAGKTTTFYLITGLIKPEGGRVLMDGEDISKFSMNARAMKGIGYLPQEPSIFKNATVEENILMIWEMRPDLKINKKERLDKFLEEFSILRLRKEKACALSGGERRRVEVARALCTFPSFLLLDEPFTGVDPIAISELQGVITGLRAKGIGVLITDHNVRDTLSITDRAYIIHEGKVLVSGASDDVAQSEVAKKYFFGENFSW